MSEFKPGDRVVTTVNVDPIPIRTCGTVVDVYRASLLIRYDGDTSPGRLTPIDAVKLADN